MKSLGLIDKLKIKKEYKKFCIDNIIAYCNKLGKVEGIVPIVQNIEIIICNKDNFKKLIGIDIEVDEKYNKNILVANIPFEKRLFTVLFIFDYPKDEYYKEFSIIKVLPEMDVQECKKDIMGYREKLVKVVNERGEDEKFRIR